jgi:hypothetical protein
MVQHSCHHAPVHALAELDDTSSEAMALLGKGLDRATGDVVARCNCGKGHFIAQVAKLKGCVGAAVYAGLFLLGWGIFFKRSSRLDPTGSVSFALFISWGG